MTSAPVLISFTLPEAVSETVQAAAAKHNLSPTDYCKAVVVELATTIAENAQCKDARRKVRTQRE